MGPDLDTPIALTGIDGSPVLVSNAYVGDYGVLTVEADGNWTYYLDNDNPDVQALGLFVNAPLSLTDVITINYVDENGDVVGTTNISVSVSGTNDPTTAVDDARLIREDVTISLENNTELDPVDPDVPGDEGEFDDDLAVDNNGAPEVVLFNEEFVVSGNVLDNDSDVDAIDQAVNSSEFTAPFVSQVAVTNVSAWYSVRTIGRCSRYFCARHAHHRQ